MRTTRGPQKNCKVFTMVFTIISTFYFCKASYSHMILLQVLIQLTTWNYWMQIMIQKLQFLPFIYLEEKNGWIVNHIHLHLFHISNQSTHAIHNFSSFYGHVLHYLELVWTWCIMHPVDPPYPVLRISHSDSKRWWTLLGIEISCSQWKA